MTQDYAFTVRKAKVPLFGCVEKKAEQKKLWTAFADMSQIVPVEIDDDAVQLLAEDLGKDKEIFGLPFRYVRGRFPTKVEGIGGTTLGNFGEALTYLLNRGSGRRLVRVVGYEPGDIPRKGNKFPQPDFLVYEDGALGVLEVKSTQALDFQQLRSVETWMRLRPCGEVKPCRARALAQVGYTKTGKRQDHKHKLKTEVDDQRVVPFPADFGIVMAVLAVDGRVRESLSGSTKLRVQPECLKARPKRDCWTCTEADAVLVEMRNSPDRLPLVPSSGEPEWLDAYERWSRSTWARNPKMVRACSARLVALVAEWSSRVPTNAELQVFWANYIRKVAARRGIVELGDIALGEGTAVELLPGPSDGAIVQETKFEDLVREWRDVVAGGNAAFSFSYPDNAIEQTADEITVVKDESEVTMFCLSQGWVRSEPISDKVAASVAGQLLNLALRLDGWPEDRGPFMPRPMLKRATATVGESEIFLGWLASLNIDDANGPRHLSEYFRLMFMGATGSVWPLRFALSDPRLQLMVFPDGRALLRFPTP